MREKIYKKDILPELLAAATPDTLKNLVRHLTDSHIEVRRECLDYLKKYAPLSTAQKKMSDNEEILLCWYELEPDLEELNEYGGGDYDVVDHVADLLYEVQKKLEAGNIGPEYRHDLLDEVLPFIESGNAGLDDALYDVAYATCYEDDDWRRLAEAFEKMNGEWKTARARDSYRKIGDHEKYLALRKLKMEYGADYYDLATFYLEKGEKEKALEVAEQGLQKGQGRMDELRAFLADHALKSGDRQRYLELQFAQTADHLTLEKFKAFRKLCSNAEWTAYEKRILDQINNAWNSEQLKIHMFLKEYESAVAILIKGGYPTHGWDDGYNLQAAKKLENYFPEEVLKFYMSGLGNLNANATRKEYAAKAKVMVKIQRLLSYVLKEEERWMDFARKVKQANLRRPAFQEEFGAVIPEWREIG